MEFVSKTDVGKKRKNNEDSLLAKKINDNIYLFIVADGLGGYSSGEVASFMATDIANSIVSSKKDELQYFDDEKMISFIKDMVGKINLEIFNKEKEDEKYKGMGTTIVAVLKINDNIYYFSVGDSRLYYITPRKDEIIQITTDDTYVNELIKNNVITKEEAITHPQKHMLTKALGVASKVSITVNRVEKKDGYLLLCSDGVTNMLSDEDILDVIRTSRFDNLAENIIETANNNGGVDNITAVIVGL